MNSNRSATGTGIRADDHYRAYRCRSFGDYADLGVEKLPPAVFGDDEVLVRTRAAAVGFPDMLMVQGNYQLKPALPFTPGAEFSGEVVAVGSAVEALARGDQVMGSVRFGAFAERVTVPQADCFKLPTPFDHAQAAAFLIAYKTAYVGLLVRGALAPGETLLVHGAAGGVGLAAVELGRHLGTTVIAAASGAEKLAVAKSKGADHVVDYRDGGFRKRVKDLTGGRGADVIYDPVGGDVFDESTHCIAPFGRLLVIGFASGRIPSAAVNYALIKQLAIVGVRAGEYGRINLAGGRAVNSALLELGNSGRLSPHVHARLPFDALVAAFDEIAGRRVVGRLVLETIDE